MMATERPSLKKLRRLQRNFDTAHRKLSAVREEILVTDGLSKGMHTAASHLSGWALELEMQFSIEALEHPENRGRKRG